ncbi:MAG: hypothetical protein JW715_11630 [Sedimentisphaerales bacterium]|nr:hypothetical protein [Sedimentisphaerales bacterium]
MELHYVIKSSGIVLALIAVVYMLRPDMAKQLMVFLQKGKRIYIDGLLNFALAVLFFAGAHQCRYPWLIYLFGSIFAIECLLIFGLGSEKTKVILDWSREESYELFQFIGLLIGIVGLLVIFSS